MPPMPHGLRRRNTHTPSRTDPRMKSLHVAPGLALLVSTITTATMLTTALPATADTGHDGRPGASAGAARPLGRSALASLRDRQARLAARPAPVFDLAASRTFTVTTTED